LADSVHSIRSYYVKINPREYFQINTKDYIFAEVLLWGDIKLVRRYVNVVMENGDRNHPFANKKKHFTYEYLIMYDKQYHTFNTKSVSEKLKKKTRKFLYKKVKGIVPTDDIRKKINLGSVFYYINYYNITIDPDDSVWNIPQSILNDN
jgi:hypothetical protein